MKKFISLIIAFAFIFSSLYMPELSYAAEEEENVDFELSCGLLKALGVIPPETDFSDVYLDSSVSRAEFASYASALMNLDARNDGTRYFEDVPSDYWAAGEINALAKLGIICGYNNAFNPEEKITMTDAISVAARITGYDAYFEITVSTPSDYLRALKKSNLGDNISSGEYLTNRDFIFLAYNILTTDMYVGKALDEYGEAEYETHSSKTVLSTYHDIYFDEGLLSETFLTSLADKSELSEGEVKIEDVLYRFNDDTDVISLIGSYVNVFYRMTDGSPVKDIVYLYEDRHTTDNLVIPAESIVSYSNGVLKYTDENYKEKKITFSRAPYIIKNGVAVLENAADAFDIDKGSVTLKKCRGAGKYNLAYIEEYKNFVVKSVDYEEEIIYNKYDNKSNLYLDSDTVKYSEVFLGSGFKRSNINIIAKDDVLSVSCSDDGSYVKIAISDTHITGTAESISNDGTDDYITISGKTYPVDKDLYLYKNIEMGRSGTFYLDVYGYVAEFKEDPSAGFVLAYLIGISKGTGVGNDVEVKVFTQNGEHKIYKLSKNVDIDGSTQDVLSVYAMLYDSAKGRCRKQLIRYSENSEGKINQIDTAAEGDSSYAADSDFRIMLEYGNHQYWQAQDLFYPTTPINTNTVVFLVPDDDANSSDNDYAISNKKTAYYQSGKYDVEAYKTNDSTPYADVIVEKGDSFKQIGFSTPVMLVSEVRKVTNFRQEETRMVYGLKGNVEYKGYLARDLRNADIDEGDIIRVTENTLGEIINYETIYDYSSGELPEWAPMKNTFENELRYTFGYVADTFAAPLRQTAVLNLIKIGYNSGAEVDNVTPTRNTEFMIFDSSRRENKAYIGNFEDITSYESSGGTQCSRIFIHAKYAANQSIIIYK